MSHFADKKAKKKAQIKRNRFHQEIYNCLRLRRAEEARVKKDFDAKNIKPEQISESVSWSAKTVSVRDRLTGKKRVSKERWNRFAGTSDGGGRGL